MPIEATLGRIGMKSGAPLLLFAPREPAKRCLGKVASTSKTSLNAARRMGSITVAPIGGEVEAAAVSPTAAAAASQAFTECGSPKGHPLHWRGNPRAIPPGHPQGEKSSLVND